MERERDERRCREPKPEHWFAEQRSGRNAVDDTLNQFEGHITTGNPAEHGELVARIMSTLFE